MQTVTLGVGPLKSSRIAYGCWRIAGSWNPAEVTPESEAIGKRAVNTAFDLGYSFFDTADVYGRGIAERLLGQVLKETPAMRDKIVIATKCGIRPKGNPSPDSPARWDFSADYLVAACEASLRRMGIDAVDIFMLHRPDYLADPQEIAKAFTLLRDSGKARFFGISNFRPTLVTAVQVTCPMPVIVHEVEISLAQMSSFTDGTLDQCLIERITPLAWSPLAGGLLGGGAKRLLTAQQKYRTDPIIAVLDEIAKARGVTRTVIALAWLLKHPAKILPIIGTTNPERIREALQSTEQELGREDWYRLLEAARGEPLP